MNRLAYISLAFVLFASLGFSTWISGIDYPSCLTSYSVLGSSFTYSVAGSTLGCSVLTTAIPTYSSTGTATVTQTSTTTGNTLNSASSCFSQFYSAPVSCSFSTVSNITYNISANGTYNGTITFTGSASGGGTASTTLNVSNATASMIITTDTAITITKNGTSVIFSNGTSNLTFVTSILFYISSTASTGLTYADASAATNVAIYTTPQGILTSSSTEITNSTNTSTYSTPYISIYNATVVRSDFKNARVNLASPAGYCQARLYFSNLTNTISISPKITYIPSTNAFGDFYNANDSYVSYVLNNTGAYILDRDTELWFAVPAFICADFTTQYTISTLMMNATSGTNARLTQFRLTNSLNQPIENAVINILTLTGSLVSAITTDANGVAMLALDPLTAYNANISSAGIIYQFTNLHSDCPNPYSACFIELQILSQQNFSSLSVYSVNQSTCTYNNVSGNVSCSSLINGTSSLQVFLNTPYNSTVICTNSNSCIVNISNCYNAVFSVSANGSSYALNGFQMGDCTIANETTAGDGGLIGAFLIIFTLGLIGIMIHPSIGVALLIPGLLLSKGLMLLAVPWEGVIIMSLALLIIAYSIK